ncbi:conjugal transfer protein, partial [Nocardiopsis nanhaiensis]
MDLPTYTNIWRIEKRLYKLYDFRLPMPLPVGTFGVALGVFALWVVLLSIVNAPFDFGNGWHLVLWVVPPGVITVLATRPVIEGKRLTELLISQARFLTEARVFTRLAPEYEPSEIRVSVRVWHRHPDAGPLPLTRSAARRAQAEEALDPEAEEAADAGVEAVDEAVGEALPEDRVEGRLRTSRELRAAREAAPPLRGVPTPEPTPVSTGSPVSAPEPASVPEPDAPEDTPARKVPVAAAATSGAQNSARSGNPPSEEAEAVAEQKDENEWFEHRAAATDLPEHGGERPRGVGRRVLNYFGFGLDTPPPDRDQDGGDHGRARGDGDRGDSSEGELSPEHDFGEPVYVTEEEEQRDRDEWFAQLRASSGHTPLGLTSKGAYASSDTGAMSSSELSEAVRPRERSSSGPDGRRRAEEIMSAPEPASRPEPAAEEGSAAARRLRGRVQGIRVAEDLADRGVRVTGPEEGPDQSTEQSPAEGKEQGREKGPQAAAESAPVRERARQAPPARPARA